jgi:hypothetical protein
VTIPSRWKDNAGFQRTVASDLNPLLQGYLWPRWDDAPSPDPNEAYSYYDLTKHTPGWFNGTAFQYFVGADSSGNVTLSGDLKTTGMIGYRTGAGGTVTQGTSRTTGVTIDKACGRITLFSAAGSTSWQTFTVTCSKIDAVDTVILNQKSGADKYMLHVSAVAAGSFDITFATTGGTTTEQPVFNFAIIKAVVA